MTSYTLITGASSGIGLELAKIFAANGHNLILVARNEKALTQLKGEVEEQYKIKAIVITIDLAQPSAASKLYKKTKEQNLKVDVLINNAGFGLAGYFYETDLQTELDMITVNVTSLIHLTKLFLNDMKENGNGKILNVASTAAFMPGPKLSVYYATKAMVFSFTRAIAYEVKKHGIQISVLCPGPTATGFSARAKNHQSRVFKNGWGIVMSAHKVAQIGYRQMMKGKPVIIPGVLNKLSVFSVRLIPRSVMLHLIYWLNTLQ